MDMSVHWNPPTGPNEPTEGTSAPAGGGAGVPATHDSGSIYGEAIPLPPANSNLGAPYPPEGMQSQLPPTGATPTVGPPTPPFGVWAAPPGSGWAPGTPAGAPFGDGWPGAAGGSIPPHGGWPAPGFPSPVLQPPTSKGHNGLVAAVATVAIVVALLAGAGLGHVAWTSQNTSTSPSGPSSGTFGGPSSSGGTSPFGSGSTGNSSTGAGAPSDISSIASKVDPALVDINTNLSYENEEAAGTGMVLTSGGEILTNNHVIDGATSISVTDVGSGKTYSAKVVGYDRTGDVAVIKLVNASGLRTISTSSDTPAVGQAVIGVGNAGGTGGTPSAAGGSITALSQSITASDGNGGNAESLTGLIGINAGIEPGYSGGPLVNTSGQVLGMDTAASTGSVYQVSAAHAYAIPIGTALSIAKQIEAGDGSSTVHIGATGFLGISVQDTSSGVGGSGGAGFGGRRPGGFGSSGSGGGSTTSGAVVEGTLSGSPGAQAGLVQGDVITGLDGEPIASANDLTNLLGAHHPGDTVQLQWTDQSGQSHTAGVTLTSGPPA
jgi:S1-C subfamily serine protease